MIHLSPWDIAVVLVYAAGVLLIVFAHQNIFEVHNHVELVVL